MVCFADRVAQIDAGQDREDISLHNSNQQFESVDRGNRRNQPHKLRMKPMKKEHMIACLEATRPTGSVPRYRITCRSNMVFHDGQSHCMVHFQLVDEAGDDDHRALSPSELQMIQFAIALGDDCPDWIKPQSDVAPA